MKKRESVRIINDERMYDYFHNLLEEGLDFLESGKKDEKKGKSMAEKLNFVQL